MTREEWHSHAKGLWADLVDERGRLLLHTDEARGLNTGSIAGAAQATLETVYGPHAVRCGFLRLHMCNEHEQLQGQSTQ